MAADNPANRDAFDNLVGPYLLDALNVEDRERFETYLRTSVETQREVALLKPVVDLLPLALDEPSAEFTPSFDLRRRILAEARAERPAGEREVGLGAPEPEQPRFLTRPGGPIDRGPRARPIEPDAARGRLVPFYRSAAFARIAAGLLVLVTAAALTWALVLQNRIDDKDAQIDDLQGQLGLNGTGEVQAVVYTLAPTADGPTGANGVLALLNAQDNRANLTMVNLPAPGAGRAYQLWFLKLDASQQPTSVVPSVTFTTNPDGSAVVQGVPTEGSFDAVAVTNEPEGGSQSPTTPILFLGTQGTAKG